MQFNNKSVVQLLAPCSEQKLIGAEVDRRLSMVENLSALVNVNLQRATIVRQPFLQKAFTGRL